jgi:hypothetical protein
MSNKEEGKHVQILALLRIATDLIDTIAALAQDDPEVWEKIKGDYNAAVEAFKNAPNTKR